MTLSQLLNGGKGVLLVSAKYVIRLKKALVLLKSSGIGT